MIMEWIVEIDEDKNIMDAKWVVEIVRCKDCKNRMTELSNDAKTMCYCPLVDRYTVDNWYCADGERKDE